MADAQKKSLDPLKMLTDFGGILADSIVPGPGGRQQISVSRVLDLGGIRTQERKARELQMEFELERFKGAKLRNAVDALALTPEAEAQRKAALTATELSNILQQREVDQLEEARRRAPSLVKALQQAPGADDNVDALLANMDPETLGAVSEAYTKAAINAAVETEKARNLAQQATVTATHFSDYIDGIISNEDQFAMFPGVLASARLSRMMLDAGTPPPEVVSELLTRGQMQLSQTHIEGTVDQVLQRDIKKKKFDIEETLGELQVIRALTHKEFLSAQGMFAAKIADFKAWTRTANKREKKLVAAYAGWRGMVDNRRNMYVHEMTGVAASPVERESYKTVFPDIGDSEPEFFAKLNAVEEYYKRKDTHTAEWIVEHNGRYPTEEEQAELNAMAAREMFRSYMEEKAAAIGAPIVMPDPAAAPTEDTDNLLDLLEQGQ